MYYERHYIISNNTKIPHFRKVLEHEYGIACTIVEPGNALVFDVEGNHPKIKEIESLLPEETPGYILEQQLKSRQHNPERVLILYKPVFSEEERLTARWLSVRNMFSKLHAANPEQVYDYSCKLGFDHAGFPIGMHVFQPENYIFKSKTKWGRNHFASSAVDEHRLFCDDLARTVLLQSNIHGILFSPVIKKSTNQPMDDIYQLHATTEFPGEYIVPSSNMECVTCPKCGMKMFRALNQMARYKIVGDTLQDNLDFYQTPPMFLGRGKYYGRSELLISQKMYRILRDNALDRSFVFEPVD